jgi:hypothetical protein
VAITSLHTSNAKTVNSAKANCDGASVSLEERPEVKAKERAIVASIEAVENKSRDAGRNYFNTVAEIEELKKLYPREMMQEYLTPELTWLGRVKKAFELRRV